MESKLAKLYKKLEALNDKEKEMGLESYFLDYLKEKSSFNNNEVAMIKQHQSKGTIREVSEEAATVAAQEEAAEAANEEFVRVMALYSQARKNMSTNKINTINKIRDLLTDYKKMQKNSDDANNAFGEIQSQCSLISIDNISMGSTLEIAKQLNTMESKEEEAIKDGFFAALLTYMYEMHPYEEEKQEEKDERDKLIKEKTTQLNRILGVSETDAAGAASVVDLRKSLQYCVDKQIESERLDVIKNEYFHDLDKERSKQVEILGGQSVSAQIRQDVERLLEFDTSNEADAIKYLSIETDIEYELINIAKAKYDASSIIVGTLSEAREKVELAKKKGELGEPETTVEKIVNFVSEMKASLIAESKLNTRFAGIETVLKAVQGELEEKRKSILNKKETGLTREDINVFLKYRSAIKVRKNEDGTVQESLISEQLKKSTAQIEEKMDLMNLMVELAQAEDIKEFKENMPKEASMDEMLKVDPLGQGRLRLYEESLAAGLRKSRKSVYDQLNILGKGKEKIAETVKDRLEEKVIVVKAVGEQGIKIKNLTSKDYATLVELSHKIKEHPKNVGYLEDIAEIYRRQGSNNKALADLQLALSIVSEEAEEAKAQTTQATKKASYYGEVKKTKDVDTTLRSEVYDEKYAQKAREYELKTAHLMAVKELYLKIVNERNELDLGSINTLLDDVNKDLNNRSMLETERASEITQLKKLKNDFASGEPWVDDISDLYRDVFKKRQLLKRVEKGMQMDRRQLQEIQQKGGLIKIKRELKNSENTLSKIEGLLGFLSKDFSLSEDFCRFETIKGREAKQQSLKVWQYTVKSFTLEEKESLEKRYITQIEQRIAALSELNQKSEAEIESTTLAPFNTMKEWVYGKKEAGSVDVDETLDEFVDKLKLKEIQDKLINNAGKEMLAIDGEISKLEKEEGSELEKEQGNEACRAFVQLFTIAHMRNDGVDFILAKDILEHMMEEMLKKADQGSQVKEITAEERDMLGKDVETLARFFKDYFNNPDNIEDKKEFVDVNFEGDEEKLTSLRTRLSNLMESEKDTIKGRRSASEFDESLIEMLADRLIEMKIFTETADDAKSSTVSPGDARKKAKAREKATQERQKKEDMQGAKKTYVAKKQGGNEGKGGDVEEKIATPKLVMQSLESTASAERLKEEFNSYVTEKLEGLQLVEAELKNFKYDDFVGLFESKKDLEEFDEIKLIDKKSIFYKVKGNLTPVKSGKLWEPEKPTEEVVNRRDLLGASLDELNAAQEIQRADLEVQVKGAESKQAELKEKIDALKTKGLGEVIEVGDLFGPASEPDLGLDSDAPSDSDPTSPTGGSKKEG